MIHRKISFYKLPLLVVLVYVVMFGILFRDFNKGLWWDEASFLIVVKEIVGQKVCGSETNRSWEWARFPGYPLTLAPFVLLFGLNLSVLRILQTVFMIVSLCFLYLLASELYGKKVASISIILLSTSWIVMFYWLRLLAHIEAMAIAILAIYLFYTGWFRNSPIRLALAGLVLGFMYLLRIEAIPIILGLLIFLIITEKLSFFKQKKFYILVGTFLIPFTSYQLWQYHRFGDVFYQERLIYELVREMNESYFAYFEMLPHVIAGSMFGIHITLLIFIIGLVYIILHYKEKKYLLLAVLFIFYLLTTSLSPHHEDRYLIPILPVTFLIISIAIVLITNTVVKQEHYRVALSFLLTIFLSYLSLSYGWPIIRIKAPTYSVTLEASKELNKLPNTYVIVPFSVEAPHPQLCLFAENKIFLKLPVFENLSSEENFNLLLQLAREKDALIYYAFPYDGDVDYLTLRRFFTLYGFDETSYSKWLEKTGLEIVRILREETGALVIIYRVKK
ncbi:MAG: glycosyltransferase family 39 protein [Candidatus Nanoarchaeia archaeon]|nr:glycosyltransferase family 39 protein [Candidatus Haiyanarchaeum thermophilum]MCW1303579.1 glycosyltransferase family 39 protein [Candidatus Haiyanarchaeum thermophilum]MCW1306261.1 glycosyltransferase family 39 protein [Candidatus Haiyanarchaeum thermophilum]MCW1307900.1 glycosyltransferase family 39 protein [Candidatus Haiyanarchaeum thermophilum]MCW1308517.1 glycosyltransferase family 39 protein [Candidatus Haiyanarchaeum thermophilum]